MCTCSFIYIVEDSNPPSFPAECSEFELHVLVFEFERHYESHSHDAPVTHSRPFVFRSRSVCVPALGHGSHPGWPAALIWNARLRFGRPLWHAALIRAHTRRSCSGHLSIGLNPALSLWELLGGELENSREKRVEYIPSQRLETSEQAQFGSRTVVRRGRVVNFEMYG